LEAETPASARIREGRPKFSTGLLLEIKKQENVAPAGSLNAQRRSIDEARAKE
jgi:hypothetical protein